MSRRSPKNPYAKPDRFTQQAKEQGFRARSVFKLSEIEQKVPLLRPGMRVVDLGCFPGSWSQYVLQRIGASGTLVGVDLSAPSMTGGTWIVRSVLDVSADELLAALGGPADVVLSDMAPNTTGIADADHFRQIELARCALAHAAALVKPGGAFVVKVFDGQDVPVFQDEVRRVFGTVKRFRPEAVRQVSREFFLVGLDRKPAA